MMKYNLIALIIPLLFVGCINSAPEYNSVIKVDFTKVAIPDFDISKVTYLSIDSQSIVGRNYTLKINSKYYVVADNSKIIVFHKDGQVKNVISPIGRSDKEVLVINYFIVNDDYIEIFDAPRSRLVQYDFDGKFIKQITVLQNSDEYVKFDDKYVFDNQSNINQINSTLVIYDQKNNIIKDTLDIYAKGLNYGSGSKFQFDKNRLYYLPSFHNVIYEITKDNTLKTAYVFDFGNYWMNKHDCNKYADHSNIFALWKQMVEDNKLGFMKFLKSEPWLILNFELGDQKFYWFYNELTKDQFMVNNSTKEIVSNTLTSYNGEFFAIYDAAEYIDKYGDSNITLADTSNPVIVSYTLGVSSK